MKIITDLYKKTEGVLYNYNKIKREIKNLLIEIEAVKNSYNGCSSMVYTEPTSETYKVGSSIESEVIEKENLISRLSYELFEKQMLIKKIDNVIEDLDENKKFILENKYLCTDTKKMTWQQIGIMINTDASNCCKMRRELINEISDCIWISEKYQVYTKNDQRFTRNDHDFTKTHQTITKNVV